MITIFTLTTKVFFSEGQQATTHGENFGQPETGITTEEIKQPPITTEQIPQTTTSSEVPQAQAPTSENSQQQMH